MSVFSGFTTGQTWFLFAGNKCRLCKGCRSECQAYYRTGKYCTIIPDNKTEIVIKKAALDRICIFESMFFLLGNNY